MRCTLRNHSAVTQYDSQLPPYGRRQSPVVSLWTKLLIITTCCIASLSPATADETAAVISKQPSPPPVGSQGHSHKNSTTAKRSTLGLAVEAAADASATTRKMLARNFTPNDHSAVTLLAPAMADVSGLFPLERSLSLIHI